MSESRELQLVEDHGRELAPADLFGTGPRERLDAAKATANLLAPVIRDKGLSIKIQGREHVKFEGWTLLGSLLGVFPVTETVTQLECGGFEARVVAKTLSGSIVGAAVARCSRTERTWEKRDDFALSSMAQTRAGAKALRMPLGFVMQLAGYDATPADEMTVDMEPPPSRSSAPEPAAQTRPTPASGGARVISDKQRARLFAIAGAAEKRIDVSSDDMAAFVKAWLSDVGLESSKDLTKEPYENLCAALESLTLEGFNAAASAEPSVF